MSVENSTQTIQEIEKIFVPPSWLQWQVVDSTRFINCQVYYETSSSILKSALAALKTGDEGV
jgi:hypothetical protein